jgi:predicted ATPase/DNA-binding SARP family transcriptional activator
VILALQCRVELFGGVRIAYGGNVIDRFRTHRASELLAFLAYHLDQAHHREALVDRFWPHMKLEAGRQNLSQALSALRRQLEAAQLSATRVLVADRITVRLNASAVSTDVAEFAGLLDQATATVDARRRVDLLDRAVALYKGELLPGPWGEWVLPEQLRWSERHIDGLHHLAVALEALGQLERALDTTERAVAGNPYREELHQTRMRLCAALGRHEAARHAYDALVRVLDVDLGTKPSPESRRLLDRIEKEPETFLAPRSASRHEATGCHTQRSAPTVPEAPHAEAPGSTPSLPLTLTRFFGREQELDRLGELLSSGSRLITLTGPGGIGKTRLAIEVARRMGPELHGRTWFVDLSSSNSPQALSEALLRGLGMPASPSADPLERAVTMLSSAPGLLILDCFEQLLHEPDSDSGALPRAGAALVRLILQRAPKLTCIVTSRRLLLMGGEQEFPVPPLPVPTPSDLPHAILCNPAVRLFVDRATEARADFRLMEYDAPTVAELCVRLDGIPLAVELAAARSRVLTPTGILTAVERPFALLVSRSRDLPERHRTLRATMDWSYALLPPDVQRMLARLSVFRGGWTLTAAEEVCDEPRVLEGLEQLREASWLTTDEVGPELRFRWLQTIREYAADKLSPNERSIFRLRHARYYLDLAQRAEDEIQGLHQKACLRRLDAEYPDLMAALEALVEHDGAGDESLRLAACLRHYWVIRGLVKDGHTALSKALGRGHQQSLDRARALAALAWMEWWLNNWDVSRHRFKESYKISMGLNARPEIITAITGKGWAWMSRSKHRQSRFCLEIGLKLSRAEQDDRGICNALNGLGCLLHGEERPDEARDCYERCLALAHRTGPPRMVAGILNNYAFVNIAQTRYSDAAAQHRAALAIYKDLGDQPSVALVLGNLGWVMGLQGDQIGSRRCLDEALALQQKLGDPRLIAATLANLGGVDRADGDFASGRARLRDAIRMFHDIDHPAGELPSIESLACLEAEAGNAERAVRLRYSAEATRRLSGLRVHENEELDHTRAMETCRELLGGARYEVARRAGLAMPREIAVQLALGDDFMNRHARSRSGAPD